jgi:single-strand DNA-binding protein
MQLDSPHKSFRTKTESSLNMANEITLNGNLGQDSELTFIPSGKAKLEFSIGDTPRRLNRDTNTWEDAGETTWWRVTEWGDKAEALAEHLRKGVKVLVTGTASVRTYERKDGTKGFSPEVKPRNIAIVPKAGGQQGNWDKQPAQASASWGNGETAPAPF